MTDPAGAGERTRVVCASQGHLVLDVGMDGRPRHESSSFGPVPRLMEVVRGLDGKETHAVVRLDREGADIEVIDPSGAIVTATDVTGEHDELRKVGVGGASQRRFQARAEDSWKHNANQIAAELDRLVRHLRLGVVFLEGEEHMASYLLEQASGPTAELLVRLDTGGRAATSETAEARPGCGAGPAPCPRDARLLERFGDAKGAGSTVEGWDAVTRRSPRPRSPTSCSIPTSGTVSGSAGRGVDHRGSRPERPHLVAGSGGAEISLVAEPFDTKEGVAAILRWNDASTPE